MSAASQQCSLAYPDKFNAAVQFWKLQPKGAKPLSQENQLLLYALHQQATVGPNTTPRPWGWNVVETTKWQGWKELGKMTTMEAMRLFVRTFEEEQSDWWALLQQAETQAEPVASDPVPAPPRSVLERAVLGWWTQLDGAAVTTTAAGAESSKKPLPRYESAAAVLDNQVYILGGNYGGRYLSDVWVLDLATAVWSPLQLQPAGEPAEQSGATAAPAAAFSPTAGHTATAWNGKLYVLGGHTKAKGPGSMVLRVVDPVAQTVAAPETAGQAPPSRGGHTATLLGSKLWIFGGEDSSRRALGDVHVLDLESLTWSSPELSGKAPHARSACCATAFLDRYIVFFGGGSVASCYNDVHLLDTETLTWSQPSQAGAKVSPRAGHTGAVMDDIWYIVGGGNNVKGCADLLAADLSGLASGTIKWHVVTSVALRDPLSSEGISMVALPQERVLLAFGGYNGKYQNAVSLFRAPEGSASLLAGPAAEAATAVEAAKKQLPTGPAEGTAAGSAPAAAGPKQAPVEPTTAPAAGAAPATGPKVAGEANGGSAVAAAAHVSELRHQVNELKSQLEVARQEAETAIRETAAAKEGAAHELALLRKQLTVAQAVLGDANKTLDDTRAALAAEQSKVLKLEAQSAELQSKLGQLSELERELEKYRRAARETVEAAAKKSGGLWGYIAGGSSS